MAFNPALDRISTEARQVHFRRAFLTVLAFVFYALGWIIAKALLVAWVSLAWTFAAIRLGWQDALRDRVGPSR